MYTGRLPHTRKGKYTFFQAHLVKHKDGKLAGRKFGII